MFASDDQHTTNVDLSSILIDYSVDENNRLHSKQLLKTFMDTAASLPNAKLSLLDILDRLLLACKDFVPRLRKYPV